MFTLEHWKRLRAASGSDLRFGGALVAALAVTLLLCVHLLSAWTDDQNYRVQAVNALGPETRVIVTGSSHVFATLNPALVQVPAMNLAAPVCSYVCVEGILRGNLAKVPPLQALIVEYDAVPLFYDTLLAYRGDHRALLDLDPEIFSMAISGWHKYELWRDQSLERSFLGPLFRPGKVTPDEALRKLRGERRTEDSMVAPGYANGPEVMPPEEDGAARVARHLREAAGASELTRNEAALRRVIELALSRGLLLVLMRFPHHPSYWANLPPTWQAQLDALMGRLERDYPEAFSYWDFGELSWLTAQNYRNGDHVNDGGAARVTAAFDRQLSAWLGSRAGGAAARLPERRARVDRP